MMFFHWFGLILAFGLLNIAMCSKGDHCTSDGDCLPKEFKDYADTFTFECKNKECQCKHGTISDKDTNCRGPNYCTGTDMCVPKEDVDCRDNECTCYKGLPVRDKSSGKITSCDRSGFSDCKKDEDCGDDKSCTDGTCACRWGQIRYFKSLVAHCRTLSSCDHDAQCSYVGGYCDIDTLECNCKEGTPLKNDMGVIYRCGPDWAGILVPIIIAVLLLLACFVIIIVLFVRWVINK